MKSFLHFTIEIFVLLNFCIITGSTLIGQTMFHYNPKHTGYSEAPDLNQFQQVQWQFKTGGKIFSSPVISGGILYCGSDDSCLYAIDPATGTQIWKFTTGGAVRSTPSVNDGRVYFGSYDGKFYALDALTGDSIWSFQTEGEHLRRKQGLFGWTPSGLMMDDFFDFMLSSPVVDDTSVYFGSGDGNIYALWKSSGIKKWNYKTGDVVHSSPALAQGKIICGSMDAYLYCLDASTGTELWKFKTGTDASGLMMGIQASPMIKDSIVYVGCRDANFYAVNINTGKQRWLTGNSGAWVVSTAAIADTIVYFANSDQFRIRAVKASNGSHIFQCDTKTYSYSSPTVTQSVLYFGTMSGFIYAIDRITGAELWSFQTEASRQNIDTILSAGRVNWTALALRLTGSTNLYPYSTNLLCWNAFLKLGGFFSSPLVEGNIVYAGSTDGYVYALECNTGTKVLEETSGIINGFRLRQNFPNPFNPETSISYDVFHPSVVSLDIYNVLGEKIISLVNAYRQKGTYTEHWNGLDYAGGQVPTGVYFCQLRSNNSMQKTIKMLMLK